MQKHLQRLSWLGAILLLNGCATRSAIVIDASSDIIRIDKPVSAKVSITRDGKTWINAGTMTIPAGWCAGPFVPP